MTASPPAILFELAAEQLLPVLRRATGDPALRDFELVCTRQLPPERLGYCAQVRIPTFRGRTEAGRDWELTLFIKRLHWNHDHEARHFEFLERMSLPVVHCYGCMPGACGVEILFLEYLARTGVDGADPAHLARYLTLHARLNALGVSADYPVRPIGADALVREWTAAIDDVLRCGRADQLGEALAAYCRAHSRDELLEYAPHTAAAVARMPQALNHGEAGFANCGWRGEELVLFDLHKFGPAPRFRDIAGTVCQLRDGTVTGLSLERGADLYLREYGSAGGGRVDRAQFLAEVDDLLRYNSYNLLAWLKGGSMESESFVDKGREVHRGWLLQLLHRILPP